MGGLVWWKGKKEKKEGGGVGIGIWDGDRGW